MWDAADRRAGQTLLPVRGSSYVSRMSFAKDCDATTAQSNGRASLRNLPVHGLGGDENIRRREL